MKTLIETFQGVLGLAFILVVIYGMYCFVCVFLNTSPLTERGMEWQRSHNPEFLKAEALQRMAKAQEDANKNE